MGLYILCYHIETRVKMITEKLIRWTMKNVSLIIKLQFNYSLNFNDFLIKLLLPDSLV